jgi:GTPase SAR1 family protein
MEKDSVKVVLLGMQSVGKTCIVERFINGKFEVNPTAVSISSFFFELAKRADCRCRICSKEDYRWREERGTWCLGSALRSVSCFRLFVQDTAGSERFESMSKIYYRDSRAAIVCYGSLVTLRQKTRANPENEQISPAKRPLTKLTFGLVNCSQTSRHARYSSLARNVRLRLFCFF